MKTAEKKTRVYKLKRDVDTPEDLGRKGAIRIREIIAEHLGRDDYKHEDKLFQKLDEELMDLYSCTNEEDECKALNEVAARKAEEKLAMAIDILFHDIKIALIEIGIEPDFMDRRELDSTVGIMVAFIVDMYADEWNNHNEFADRFDGSYYEE